MAKRFIEISKGLNKVTLGENTSELEKEAVHLLYAVWFLNQFCHEADDNDIEISKGVSSLTFQDAHLTLHLQNLSSLNVFLSKR